MQGLGESSSSPLNHLGSLTNPWNPLCCPPVALCLSYINKCSEGSGGLCSAPNCGGHGGAVGQAVALAVCAKVWHGLGSCLGIWRGLGVEKRDGRQQWREDEIWVGKKAHHGARGNKGIAAVSAKRLTWWFGGAARVPG